MEHSMSRLRRTVLAVTTAAVAAAVAVSLAPTAGAAPAEQSAPAKWTAHLKPSAQGGMSTQSAGSGSRSGDFTTDGLNDILARDARNGELKVYPHSGAYVGTGTYLPSTTVNYGWGGIRWIGQGEMTGDGRADVLYIDGGGTLRIAKHSGIWNGTGTLLGGEVIGTGWNINDLVFTDDFDGDGLDDVLGRRAGGGEVYLYRNSGLGGLSSFEAPQLAVSGPTDIVEMTMGDFTLDGVTDLLFLQPDGWMGLFDFITGETYWLGYGWNGIAAITLADVNLDGYVDILGRRGSDGALLAYTHTLYFQPNAEGLAFNTLNSPTLMGYNWHINNVIV